MQDNAEQYKTLGSVGGMGSSAQAGGFSAGPNIAGKGGARGDSSPQMAGKPKSGGNVLVGGHFGPTTAAAPAGEYGQGDMYAASKESGFGTGPVGGAKAGGNLLGGSLDSQGNPKASQGANGYNQGDMFAGKAK
jgi:hypothetical protein